MNAYDSPSPARQVLIICSGNTCRSPMAEGILRRLLPASLRSVVGVASAGTGALEGAPAAPEAIRVTAGEGIPLGAHRARRLTADMVKDADLLLALDRLHYSTVLVLDPSAKERAHLLRGFASGLPAGEGDGIPDPIGGGEQFYRAVYREIYLALEQALPRIVALAEGVS